MQFDVWYELELRTLAEGEDVTTELLNEAHAAVQPTAADDADDEETPA